MSFLKRSVDLGRLLLIASITLTSWSCATQKELIKSEPVDVAVEHLIGAVDQALENAYQRHSEDLGLTLVEVALEIETEVDKNLDEDLSISVVKIEGSESEAVSQTLTLVLDPPKKGSGTQAQAPSTRLSEVVRHLEEGIEGAILAAKGAKAGLERAHPEGIPLEAKKIKVELGFVLSTTGEGLPTVSIFGISLGAERIRTRTHGVSLAFTVD